MRTNWWDNVVWLVLFLFLIPSSLAVAAWGSLPGQRLYQIKLFTERAGTVFAFSDEAKSKVQVALTGKRLDEATQLLTDESSADGLEYFRKQVEEAKLAIARAPAGNARNLLTVEYLRKLENASHQLEQQKQVISQANGYTEPSYAQPAPAGRVVSKQPATVRQVVVVNQVTQVTQVVQVVNVIQQINQTQQQIASTISQVQSMSDSVSTPPPPISTPMPTELPPPPTNSPMPIQPPAIQPFMQPTIDPTVTQSPSVENTPTEGPGNSGNGNNNGEGNQGN